MIISIYDIQKPLGEGGMGKVYLGADIKGNVVAIKEMLAEYVTNSDLRARFHKEVEISSKMEHPSIVKMYASFEENGNLYLVMEYVEGETIEQYVRRNGAIAEEEAVRIICETLDALGYAHEKGFVHRDIKPSNIMIRLDGSVCLLDFGIAKDMKSNELTVGQVTIGTDGYMSPEQAGGYNIDHRSDIYALGCVLFYMLTGHHAIEKKSNNFETRMAIVENDFPPLATYNHNTSVKVQTILNKATHKNMQQRFQSCSEFIETFKKGEAVTEVAPAISFKSEVNIFNANPNGGETMIAKDGTIISIGRENCEINIPNLKVSRHHADIKIFNSGGHTTYLFEDHSSNGTAINGKRVHNATMEIIPQNRPNIYLAGSVELKWNTVESVLRRKGVDATQIASGYTAPVNQAGYKQTPVYTQSANGNGIASFVCGILSLLVPYGGLILGIIAVVITSATGLGKAGKIIGILGIVFNGIALIILLTSGITLASLFL
ncbi:protein kinase [Spirochaetia bacterium]|nr:protein kinase [Spirochaetia bacterium]